MKRTFKTDSEQTKQFYLENRQQIESFFSNTSKLFNIEFEESDISKMLDQHCGIDYILKSNGKVYGVAARINFMVRHHGHVTIRYTRSNGNKTEFEKRCESIKSNSAEIYASITMQIDALNNRVVRMIVFESDNLYLELLKDKEAYEKRFLNVNQNDGNTFLKISYEEIKELSQKAGFRVATKEFDQQLAA